MYMLKSTVFWVITPYISKRARRFGGTSSIFRIEKEAKEETSIRKLAIYFCCRFFAWINLKL
jgi:hypothetical protein